MNDTYLVPVDQCYALVIGRARWRSIGWHRGLEAIAKFFATLSDRASVYEKKVMPDLLSHQEGCCCLADSL